MKYTLILILFVSCICMEAQTETSALYSIAPATNPPAAVFIGQLWLNTTVGRLEWLSSLSPVTWLPTAPASVTGSILFIASGTCPAGTVEATELDGVMLRGTLTAHGNVGTTGGSDTITPTINSLTAAAQTFTGDSNTTSAVSAGTPAGTNGSSAVSGTSATEAAHTHSVTSNVVQNVFTNPTIAWPLGVPTHSGTTATFSGNAVAAASTGASPKLLTGNTSSGVTPVTTATGTVNITSQGTIAWPVGVPTASGGSVSLTNNAVTSGAGSSHSHGAGTYTAGAQIFTGSALGTHTHTVTPTGTNGTSAVTGTLNSFDNRPAYINVIFCKAN